MLKIQLGSVICECCDARVILVNGVLVGVLCVIGVCVLVVLWDVVGALFDIRFVLGLFDVGVPIGICELWSLCLLVFLLVYLCAYVLV